MVLNVLIVVWQIVSLDISLQVCLNKFILNRIKKGQLVDYPNCSLEMKREELQTVFVGPAFVNWFASAFSFTK
jgi:hypothetical protein